MVTVSDALSATIAAITAMGALGTASFGLVDATKAFWGGLSNIGLGDIYKALGPFQTSLAAATPDWKLLVRANWINGAPKDDQTAQAKSLIRLGLSAKTAPALAKAGHVDAAALEAAMTKSETGVALGKGDLELIGRLNAAIDVAMDTGFERADQRYRNACRLAAAAVSVVLALWAGHLLVVAKVPGFDDDATVWPLALFAGILAAPIAPVAKDLASSLQAAAKAVSAVKS